MEKSVIRLFEAANREAGPGCISISDAHARYDNQVREGGRLLQTHGEKYPQRNDIDVLFMSEKILK